MVTARFPPDARLGLKLEAKDGATVVALVGPGSVAEQQGVPLNSTLVDVNGQSTTGKPYKEVVGMITAVQGEKRLRFQPAASSAAPGRTNGITPTLPGCPWSIPAAATGMRLRTHSWCTETTWMPWASTSSAEAHLRTMTAASVIAAGPVPTRIPIDCATMLPPPEHRCIVDR